MTCSEHAPRGRALVAGGLGFIGAHVARALLAGGWAVHVVDNLITGDEHALSDLANEPRLTVTIADATEPVAAPDPYSLVVHLASPASPVHYLRHPIATLHAGSRVTENLLELARRDGARFILSSTSEVYGDPLVHPQSETYWGNVNPIGPRSVYDEAKRYAEALTAAYRREFGTDSIILRLFNTYGPGMSVDDGRAVPAFVAAALSSRPLVLHGDGSQTRSFCYIDDTVAAIVAAAGSTHEGPINVGNDDEIPLIEMARLVVELTASDSPIIAAPRPIDDPERRKPDLTRAREHLGWQPRTSLRDGLARTIEWYAALRGSPEA
ncbi:NAD-dependent epimerase/dehydratase family protein [uncultured Schumannella sp.]|uniref:NAD-dependent epimerase/dehydratase family protein n=1 Tax=uncultured Schumannella sp. TaxID=1195956 RepID=UPI0025F26902|nr:NAD-dependent epimerase/dehydratase family protein [uncultured Schumannella sp.]